MWKQVNKLEYGLVELKLFMLSYCPRAPISSGSLREISLAILLTWKHFQHLQALRVLLHVNYSKPAIQSSPNFTQGLSVDRQTRDALLSDFNNRLGIILHPQNLLFQVLNTYLAILLERIWQIIVDREKLHLVSCGCSVPEWFSFCVQARVRLKPGDAKPWDLVVKCNNLSIFPLLPQMSMLLPHNADKSWKHQ